MQVMDIDAESPNSGKVTASCKVEKLERSVRYSSVLIAALGMSLIALAVYTAVLVLTESRSPQLCLSEQCVGTAARILQNLNKDVDPCTDFYEFACGGWIKQNPMPDWAAKWNEFSKLQVQVNRDLRKLLEAKDDEGLPNSVVKTKSYYRTCMSTKNREADGMKSFYKLLQELGLPSRPPTKMSANFSWEEVAARGKRQLNLDLLLGVSVDLDLKNTTRNRIQIAQASPWAESYKDLKQYRQQIKERIRSFVDEINATLFADDIVEFSKKLYDIMNTDKEYLDLSVQQLIEGPNEAPAQWKQHDWNRYLELVFSNTSVALQDLDRVYVWNLPYLRNLSVLLANTEPVIIERYLWWMVYSKFNSKWREFLSSTSKQPRWMRCIHDVNVIEHFGHALSYLYVKRHFDYTSTKKAIEMLDDIRSAFAATVQKLDWMDSTTRQKTLDKLTAMKNLVGFPAWLLTPEQLDKYYEEVEVVEGNIFETYLKLTFWNVKRSLESLREKNDRSHWNMTATTVNALYLFNFNSVTVPAAILQPPFFGNGIEAIDYGSIGAILGHEVTHGFDTDGWRFDKDGNLNHWWSVATIRPYASRAWCIVNQYNKYKLLNDSVNGLKTQGENIADNGGLRAAFHAYQQFAKRAPADSRVSLPGLQDYKPEQLFFLGFAQTWCENSTEEALKSQMANDVHSPKKFRVNGTLSNSKEFADAWSCPAGSPMNPKHKCVLW